ncbi:MAG TPA: hypothetical protein VMU26_27630 [Candidatus Polarisedimenticolia bacterium]|nr:hypothetical protein [Candidatus Polarisedimenticolia bacterium]
MCVLTADPSDPTGTTFLVSPAGLVTIKITSLTGTVIFSPKGTTVTDSSGKQSSGTSFPAPDTYSFPTSAGQAYTLETEYVCVPPNSTGRLNEACAGGVKLADILSTTNGQIFTIKA